MAADIGVAVEVIGEPEHLSNLGMRTDAYNWVEIFQSRALVLGGGYLSERRQQNLCCFDHR